MTDYIEREAAKREISFYYGRGAARTLDHIRAADVAPVRHGRWHDVYMSSPSSFVGTCSVCGVSNDIPHPYSANYCPNCGARMDKEEQHD